MSKLIDTTGLSHFFERLKSVFMAKSEADTVYAQKNGSSDSYFAVSKLDIGPSDGYVGLARQYDTTTNTVYLKLSSGSSVALIPVTGTNSTVWTSSNFDPDAKVDCAKIVTNPALGDLGTSKFALQTPVSVFSQYSESAQNNHKVVFVRHEDAATAGVTSSGFYLSEGNSLYFICKPSNYALYYNETEGKLCRWATNAFVNITVSISGGSVVIDGETYDVASDADIDSLIDNILSD